MFYTYRGLKIRLNERYCLWRSPEHILKMDKLLSETEFLADLRGYYAFILGLLMLISKFDIKTIFIYTFYITIFGILIPLFYPFLYFYESTSFRFFRGLFSYISGWYIDKLIIIIVGLITAGWKSIVAYFTGFYLAVIISTILNYIWAKVTYKKYGLFICDVERIFINVSRYYVDKHTSFNKWIKDYLNGVSQLDSVNS